MNKHPFNRRVNAPKKHVLYNRWNNLKQLINNPNHSNYNWYGGKGITLHKAWETNFIVFLLWSTQNGFAPNLVLTRRDKSKGFNPENCFYAEHNKSLEPIKL